MSRGIALSFHDSAPGWGGWSAPRPGRFTPGKDPVPIVRTGGWLDPRAGTLLYVAVRKGVLVDRA